MKVFFQKDDWHKKTLTGVENCSNASNIRFAVELSGRLDCCDGAGRIVGSTRRTNDPCLDGDDSTRRA